ncbi:hypothetical protein YDYSY3_02780 [Paenibacillus chitinolyticus]|uniref:polymorphic toxin-type HINT domain-containing protein n=1 Tax=Paenibacillus chitinolyticus TaxID=79263 RepID=UPI0026E4A576|nr:polymorphic toxin-type HINT domain-containing protein [Paenibacillus chitinolyticus]GKS09278.1 hypothetical protein YDYSY3_02780 [Paenibacillus chitinolyticus]
MRRIGTSTLALLLILSSLFGNGSVISAANESAAGSNPDNIFSKAARFHYPDEIIQQLLDEGFSSQEIQHYIQDPTINKDTIQKKMRAQRKTFINDSKKAEGTVVNELTEKFSTSSAGMRQLSSEIPDHSYVRTRPDEAPYSVHTDNESISTLSGGISRKETDLVLPGRNGLSFALTRIYDSTDSQFGAMYVEGGSNATRTPYDMTLYQIGAGWKWDISSIEYDYGTRYLHLAGGGVYEIDNTSLLLKGYPWQDLTLAKDNTVTVDNETSYFVLKTNSGVRQYFNFEGRILQIKDLYGNKIEFRYAEHSSLGKVLNSVTDSIGNVIQIEYNEQSIVLTKGKEIVTYHKKTEQNFSLLSKVVDQAGRVTAYDYHLKTARFNLVGPTGGGFNPYALLTGISHPTGAKTLYAYEDSPVTRYTSEMSINEVYRVKNRKEQIAYQDGSLETYNDKTVEYEDDIGSSYGKDIYFTLILSDGLTRTSYHNKKDFTDKMTPVAYYTERISEVSGDSQKTTEYKYDVSRNFTIPTSIATQTTNLQTHQQSPPITVVRSYDGYKNLLSETDPMGVQSTYTYDDKFHLPSSASKPVGDGVMQYTEFTRNDRGSLLQITTKEGGAGGNVLKRTSYENYDPYGNSQQIRLKDTHRDILVQTEFGEMNRFAFPSRQSIQTVNADGQVSTITKEFIFQPSTGALEKYKDGNGHETVYEYDKIGRLTKAMFPDQSNITNHYQDNENKIISKDESGLTSYASWNPIGLKMESGLVEYGTYKAKAKYGYDTYGRQIWNEDAVGNRTQIGYDAWNRQNQITYADQAVSRIATDDYNLTQTTTDPEGNIFRQTADKLGRVVKKEQIAPTAKVLGTYQYNFAGNVVASTDANGGTTDFRYDPLGQLTAVINAKKEETKYTYDQLGQMIRITYPDNNTTQKKYDELGRLIQTTDATGKVEKLYYDGNNNQIRATDRNGTELSYVYDARNFLIEKKAPDETIRYAYDLAGRRTRMTDNTGTTQYTYQPSTGQLSKVVYPDGKTLAYDYNALGLRSSLNDPSGQNTYYQYDSRNRLSSVSSSLADEEAAYSYYRNDLIKQTRQRNGITTAYTYNGLQLQTLTHKQADGTALNTYAYEYDANENETAKTENGQTYQFGYDPLNRITSSSQYRESYAYDARGNRTSFQTNHEVNSPDADYVYDKKDRLSSVKLKDGSTISYTYNGDGLLYERTDKDGTARYYYDGDQVIAEGDGSGSLKARYVRGRELVARESGGSKAYYLHNGHGDVVELRSETGTRLNQYAYDIWGNPTVSEENISNPFRYSGEYWDSATKLQYLRARWYDPSMGRFINEDTYEGQLDNPLSLNLYTYVMNNPLKYRDPSGHCFDDSLACQYINKMKQATVDAMQSGVDAVYGTSKAIADFMFLDDLRTVTDENASNFDKGLAAAGFVPWGKLIRGGKLVIQMGNKAGKYIERASKLTEDNLKYAAKLAWNCNCFVAGTKVQTDEGEKNIEDIEVGDRVLAKNEETGEQAYKEVVQLHRNEKDTTYKLSVGNQIIETTDNHPFWVEDKGWVLAVDLQVGDELLQSNGNHLKIDSIEIVHHDEKVKVYNFTVADFHTYFVSSLGIWVHNIDCGFTLSSNNIQHIGKHIASDFASQVPYLSDKALASKLNKNSFFNPSWTKEDIITGVQNGANEAISKGFTNGYYNYSYKGDTIQLFFKDGNFDTAFGSHKLTPADFGR